MEPTDKVSIKKLVRDSVAKAAPGKSPEERKEYEKVMKEVIEEGKTPAEAMGFDEAQMETFYGIGFNLYNSGKFKEAKNIFGGLVRLDGTKSKYWYGVAATFHKLKEYERAKDFYMAWAALEPDNPLPFYHASDCCIELKQDREAILFLYMVIERCGDHLEFQKIKEKTKVTMDRLKEQVGWDKKE